MLLSEDKLNQKPYWEIDLQKVVLPLKLRRAKAGIFYPKGMKGKKLVSKFFKDEKISILARQKSGYFQIRRKMSLESSIIDKTEDFCQKTITQKYICIYEKMALAIFTICIHWL